MEAINKLTLGDVAAVEELSGQSIGAMGDEDAPKGKLLAALAFVTKRKSDKNFTFADALDLTMDEVTEIIGLDVEDPKDRN